MQPGAFELIGVDFFSLFRQMKLSEIKDLDHNPFVIDKNGKLYEIDEITFASKKYSYITFIQLENSMLELSEIFKVHNDCIFCVLVKKLKT
jgi:hypothetical protein